MSTQKAKFELFARLQALGFTYEEAQTLYRAQLTLHRWAELECGDGNDYASWAIERDETSGKPSMVTYPHDGKSYSRAIADREAGALKRLGQIISARNARAYVNGQCVNPVAAYHQGDPRGCSLYIVSAENMAPEFAAWKAANAGANNVAFPFHNYLDSLYTRGLAICA